ncbi:hypothetical protein D4764_03G0005110 [Takifugu flavidus]|uniref:Uncharacterized protein n=1 Tax=Takifugu flavidus TaxID=433684 RepID=A0A5C6N8K9_9TELE|nr:hypothetical protein D4764_03G0005110 [Takifugu flavidus]
MNVALLTAFAVSLLICEGKGSVSWADPGVTNPHTPSSLVFKRLLVSSAELDSSDFQLRRKLQVRPRRGRRGTSSAPTLFNDVFLFPQAKKMNFAVVTIVTIFLLVHEGKGKFSGAERDDVKVPCQDKSSQRNYNEFVQRHVLKEIFNRTDKQQWSRYLLEKNLCGRTRVQSFIDADENQVSQVCRTSGKRVVDGRNLCISTSNMRVYDVQSRKTSKKCTVTKVTGSNHKVVLACNKVSNKCRPVHYEKWTNQKPENVNCS